MLTEFNLFGKRVSDFMQCLWGKVQNSGRVEIQN